jgi:hypothetical protein
MKKQIFRKTPEKNPADPSVLEHFPYYYSLSRGGYVGLFSGKRRADRLSSPAPNAGKARYRLRRRAVGFEPRFWWTA